MKLENQINSPALMSLSPNDKNSELCSDATLSSLHSIKPIPPISFKQLDQTNYKGNGETPQMEPSFSKPSSAKLGLASGERKNNALISKYPNERRKSLESSNLSSFAQHVQSFSLSNKNHFSVVDRSRRLSDSNLSTATHVKPFSLHVSSSSNSRLSQKQALVPLIESESSTGKIEVDYSLESDLNRIQTTLPSIQSLDKQEKTSSKNSSTTKSKSNLTVRFSVDSIKEIRGEISEPDDKDSDTDSFDSYFVPNSTTMQNPDPPHAVKAISPQPQVPEETIIRLPPIIPNPFAATLPVHSIHEHHDVRRSLKKSPQELIDALGHVGDALKSIPVFEKNPSFLERIIQDLVIQSHQKGKCIISESQKATHFYFIIRGECFVNRTISLKTKMNGFGEEIGLEPYSEPLLSAIRKDFTLDLIEIDSGALVPCLGLGTLEDRIDMKRKGIDEVRVHLVDFFQKTQLYPFNVLAKSHSVTTGAIPIMQFLNAASNQDLYDLAMTPAVKLDTLGELQDSFIQSFEYKYERLKRERESSKY